MNIPFLDNTEVKDKRVLVRLDFDHLFEKNFKPGKMHRFGIAEPTINYLIHENAKVIIAPSFTQFNKKNKAEYSVEPYARYICDLYKCNVYLTGNSVGSVPYRLSQDMEPGSILFLENLLGMEDEKNVDSEFAEKLSLLADIYVNEAYSLSDVVLASNVAVIDYFEKENVFTGMNFGLEYSNSFLLNSSESLITLCINNDKDIAGSLTVTENLIERIERIILMGESSSLYSIIKNNIENHSYPVNIVNKFKKIINSAEVRNIDIHHMVDYHAQDKTSRTSLISNEILNNKEGYVDIGDETGKIFSDALAGAKLVLWLGDVPYNKERDLVFGSAKIFDKADKNQIYVIGLKTDSFNFDTKNQIEGGFFNFQSSCYNVFIKSITNEKLHVIEKLEAKFK